MRAASVTLIGSLALAVWMHGGAVRAQDNFYAGKSIMLVVSTSSGGGYATYARVLSRHIANHIPGTPSIVMQFREGAGGIVAANYLYNTAPRDGTVFAAIHRGAISSVPLYGGEGVKYEPPRFTWIGSLNNEISFCVSWHTSAVKTFRDMQARELIVGGVGDGSETDFYPYIVNNIFGTKVKLITGYKGGDGISLAMERGEVEGRCAWSLSSIRTSRGDWLRDNKLNFLIQFALEKNAEMPDVPLVLDLAKNADERKMLELLFTPQVLGRAYLAPPDVPADRTRILRAAFDAMVKDPAFLAEADKVQIDIAAVSGEKVAQLIDQMYATSPDLIRAAAAAMERKDR